MTYPGDMSINYGYDGAGRLTAVTGSDTLYQGITQYASGFSYRAWGARKTMTDGANRTSTTTYDLRLRPLTYQIDGGVVNQSYEYYNDSSMQYVHNISDGNFDRYYEFDHAGRLTYATTGRSVNGNSSGIPYHETFGYNAWGDTTSRFTETWEQDDFADAATFTNGRRDGWAYEGDGNIKTIETRNYGYDAAGNRISMTGQLWGGSNYFPTSTTNAYDGDGQKVEEVLSWPSTFTTRYLRSSVLGGEIAQEINSAGQTINYVYQPDGTQLSTLIGFPKWRHESPAGTGLYENFQSGFVNRVEFDPLKANVGLTAPPPPDTNGGDGDIGSNHNGGPADSRYSDMANPAGGCYDVGGAILPCTWSIFDVLDKFVWTPARNPSAASYPPDTPGKQVPPKRVVPVNIPNPFDKYLPDPVVRQDTTYVPGHWEHGPAPLLNITVNQQNGRQIVPLGNLRKGLEDLFKKGDCGAFVQKLIDKAYELYGRGQPHATSFWDAFNRIEDAGGFQFDEQGSNGATVSGDLFYGELANPYSPEIAYAGPGTVHMKAFGPIGRAARPAEAALAQALYVYKALHETLHLAKRGWYFDEDLARAGNAVDQTTPPNFPSKNYLAWSGNLDVVLQRHCPYPFE